MKRSNKLMRAAGVLLVCTLVTSSFVGGTFAKYVSKAEAADTARVAKWGVKVEVEEAVADLFENNYDKHFVETQLDHSEGTVKSSTKMDVFAPGTSGTLGKTSITGTPEVAVNVDTEAIITVTNWNIDTGAGEEFYCPLIFTITKTNASGEEETKTISGINYNLKNSGGVDSFISDLKTAIEGAYSGEFEVNTDLSEEFTDFSISWEWPFAGEGEDNTYGDKNKWTSQNGQTNEKDTLLGNKAANAVEGGTESNAPTITIELATTVTQID